MRLWPRRHRAPAELAARLAPDERVLAWARIGLDPEGAPWIGATNLGLLLPNGARLGWHEVVRASWRDGVLTVVPLVEFGDGYAGDAAPLRLALRDPDGVPETVHKRVTASVAVTEHFPLQPAGGVRIVGRKVPGVDGLRWNAHLDPGAAIGSAVDPIIHTQVEELIRQAQAAYAES